MIKEIQTMEMIIDLLNVTCKIAFITYAWITMVRLNVYIKGQTDGNDN